MKFRVKDNRIIIVKVDLKVTRECYALSLKINSNNDISRTD